MSTPWLCKTYLDAVFVLQLEEVCQGLVEGEGVRANMFKVRNELLVARYSVTPFTTGHSTYMHAD
jgi:hypothetical protein